MSPQPFTVMQLVLLARGAVRLDGAIPPIQSDAPDVIGSGDTAADQLVRKKLVEWIEVVDPVLAWKQKANKPVGLVITDLGRAALEAIETEITEDGPATSKIGHLIEKLRSAEGISLAEIVTATGWQPHSARAALTGLRKKGFIIAKEAGTNEKGPRYRIAQETVQ